MATRPPYLTITHANVAVGAASTELLAANTTGLHYVLIENLSTDQVYIKIGAAAVSGEGIQLPATNGGEVQGALELSPGSGLISLEQINGIAGGAGRTVSVTYGVR